MSEKKEKNYRTDNKSFMLYKDWEELFAELDSDEDAGRLIRALFAYSARGEKPKLTGAAKMAFLMMSSQIDRDGEKWEEMCRKRSENAFKGGKARAAKSSQMQPIAAKSSQKQPIAAKSSQKQPKAADTDTDTETDTETDIDTEKETETETDIDTEREGEGETATATDTAPVLPNAPTALPAQAHAPAPAPANTNSIIISLSEDSRRSLCGKYGESLVNEYIKRVSDYCTNTGKRYSDPASTIAKWIEQDKLKGFIRDRAETAYSSAYSPQSPQSPRSPQSSFSIEEWERFAETAVDSYLDSME